MGRAMGWRALSTTSPQPPRVSKPARTRYPSNGTSRAGMDYEGFFRKRLDALHAEGRYRIFADLERRCGRFPRAFDHRVGPEVTVWASNDYLGLGQHPVGPAAMEKTLRAGGAGAGGTP